MTSSQGARRQKMLSSGGASQVEFKETSLLDETQIRDSTTTASSSNIKSACKVSSETNSSSFGVDVDDLSDDTESDEDDDDPLDDDTINGDRLLASDGSFANHSDIQEQLAAAGPAGVAAAAAIATARKRKRPHSFETNPSVRKRQQTRLIRKLRACIDEYTMRVGQQAIVLITMPGKVVHNFKVFGAQPLESVIRACKEEIMSELEQALLQQAPQQFKEDANKHELPPLVIDGIPTPVEKMTQAQLRAFIPLMLKYSTGRGKPGWGKDTTRPPWWPETLPWANVRSDARDESEKQRISWTTTLRQIVTNCYKFHGRDDLLPIFDENDESSSGATVKQEAEEPSNRELHSMQQSSSARRQQLILNRRLQAKREQEQADQQQQQQQINLGQQVYQAAPGYASNFVHTIQNSDGTVSLIQVDPANAQILTLPDGTQVRAVRLQTLGTDSFTGQQLSELQESGQIELSAADLASAQQLANEGSTNAGNNNNGNNNNGHGMTTAISIGEATVNSEGQIVITSDEGSNCYPMSSLVSIPASIYQQFANQAGQQISIMASDGTTIPAGALSIHAIQGTDQLLIEQQPQQHSEGQSEQQESSVAREQNEEEQAKANAAAVAAGASVKVNAQTSETAESGTNNSALTGEQCEAKVDFD